jgi:hypothetical protein
MRHPKQTGLANLRMVEATIEYIGQREPDDRKSIDELPPGSASRAARLIGRGCMVKANSTRADTQAAGDRLIRRAFIETTDARIQLRTERSARLMRRVATLLLAPADKIATARQGMHSEAIAQMKQIEMQTRSLIRRDDPDSIRMAEKLSGENNELIGLGWLTWQGYPTTLGLPALNHHDRVPRERRELRTTSYDLMVVNANADGSTEVNKIQFKRECLGLCTETKETRRLRSDLQDRYQPDIGLVSGHCDLVIRPTDIKNPSLWTSYTSLQAQASGQASPQLVDEMDYHTNTLVFSMTMRDPRRMGTAYAGPAILPAAAMSEAA